MQHLYLLTDPITYAIRYVGLSNDVRRRLREHLSNTSDSLMRAWVLSLRQRGQKPIAVDCGPGTAAQELAWIKALRGRCHLFNDASGDLVWAAKQLPTRLEARAYAGLLEMLSGEKATALRRPRTSWLAMRKARETGCGRWAFAL